MNVKETSKQEMGVFKIMLGGMHTIAYGVVYPDGKCAVSTYLPNQLGTLIAVYDTFEEMTITYLHNGQATLERATLQWT